MQIPTDIIEDIKVGSGLKNLKIPLFPSDSHRTHRFSSSQSIDNWSFDCFGLNAKSKNQALKYVTFELMNRYGLLSKFKIPLTYMEVGGSVILVVMTN